MPKFRFVSICYLLVVGFSPALAEHRVLLQGDGRLAVIEADGTISWELPWGAIHDIHVLDNGNILTRRGRTEVVEIDRDSKRIVWQYDAAERNGNSGKRVEVHAFERLPGGDTMIAESGTARIIEVAPDGSLKKAVPLVTNRPNAHSDTRLVRKLDNGNYLVAHEADGMVREYDGESGRVVWDYDVPLFGKSPRQGHGPEAFGDQVFAAVRLENGNTLIATGNGHSVLEVSPDREIVWQIHQHDLPGIQLAWVTTLEVVADGKRIVIGNCHAGPGQPLLLEIDRGTKQVVWTLDRHADFGNNVSNSVLLDVAGRTIR